MSSDVRETTTNYINGDDTFTMFSSEAKWIRKIHSLAEAHPKEVHIKYENDDGSICAEIPKSYFKVSPPRKVSEEQKQAASERFKAMWQDKNSDTNT